MYQKEYEGKPFKGEIGVSSAWVWKELYPDRYSDDTEVSLYGHRRPHKMYNDIRTSLVEGMVLDATNNVMIALTTNSAYAMVGMMVDQVVDNNSYLLSLWNAAMAAPAVAVYDPIKYPSTGQFHNAIKHARHNGIRELIYEGTVKVHGTNGNMILPGRGEKILYQSKGRLLSATEDNNDFYRNYDEHREDVAQLFDEILDGLEQLEISEDQIWPIRIAGEYAGKGVQSGAAVGLVEPKFFAIFGVSFGKPDEYGRQMWMPNKLIDELLARDARIFNIFELGGVYTVKVNFDRPEDIQNVLGDITQKIEEKCPVGDYFGVEGIGEGIVWKPASFPQNSNTELWFKVKGEKHSASKVKTLAQVDPEKVANVDKFVEYAVTENRLKQGLTEVFPDGKLDVKRTGDYIRWMNVDVHKEESDSLEVSGLTMKDVSRQIGAKAREYLNGAMEEAAFQA